MQKNKVLLILLIYQIHYHLHYHILFLGTTLGNHQRECHQGIIGNMFPPFSPYKIPFSPLTYKKNTHHSIVEHVQIFAHVIFRSNSPSLKQLLICLVITVPSLPKSSIIWFVLNQNRFIFHFYLKFGTSILLRISIHINSNNLSIQQK